MAYDKHVWTCGEAITTEKLNHMEDGIADSGGGSGYTCELVEEQLTSSDVTTTQTQQTYGCVGDLSYGKYIDTDVITVELDDRQYELPRIESNLIGFAAYGYLTDSNDPDWSKAPLMVTSAEDSSDGLNQILTENPGTYSITIWVKVPTATIVDPCFIAAVRSGGSIKARTDEYALQCYRIDLGIGAIHTVPAKGSVNISLAILYTSEDNYISTSHASWGNIEHSLSNALVIPRNIHANGASVDVYNFGDSAITIESGSITAQVLSFAHEKGETACVLLGDNCSGGK